MLQIKISLKNRNEIWFKKFIDYSLITSINKIQIFPIFNYSGILTSIGRQTLLSNRCRNVADNGRIDRAPIPLTADPILPPSPSISGEKSPLDGGDETNKSLSLWLPTVSFSLSGESPSLEIRSGEASSPDDSEWSLPHPPPPPPPLRSIRRVFRRRRWMTGLVVGLRVGLPATAHWVANSLNFCRVAIASRWEIRQ